jgi:hypothetical protein
VFPLGWTYGALCATAFNRPNSGFTLVNLEYVFEELENERLAMEAEAALYNEAMERYERSLRSYRQHVQEYLDLTKLFGSTFI